MIAQLTEIALGSLTTAALGAVSRCATSTKFDVKIIHRFKAKLFMAN